ncbi:hypothetical protein JK2ML_0638 [Mycobacterium leprae Kyoto-2]|uniref:Uncharacterized protein ML0638 n=3 Tax=Mycobacterium leprae TaxID=1769 RepID=Y638_MYCLE|nr:hypothetical protein [Mycobacterium leprae]Q49769.1 RecName: Full=Uncharacterized protein ML0638 [Mycobacterium leprae TN]CAR70732.1 putative secreted protein [Mycobacterium leprae Br4923]AAA17175.1 B1937_F3_110 [Mycobacterium leprae]AWV48971.1 hypothetical protein DIJ64_03470 [Mycobacterium leprae]OAR21813.1 hypothetical protein A8144_00205 [Mycobacterium leprae 3125609]OAX72216.1 hypothetical protein A3216_00265 [Mycobacterium leprae 7935681]
MIDYNNVFGAGVVAAVSTAGTPHAATSAAAGQYRVAATGTRPWIGAILNYEVSPIFARWPRNRNHQDPWHSFWANSLPTWYRSFLKKDSHQTRKQMKRTC